MSSMDELMRQSGVPPPVPLSCFLQYPASHMGGLTVAYRHGQKEGKDCNESLDPNKAVSMLLPARKI